MPMLVTSDKPIVNKIISHLAQLGVKHVVISPGSRNAPLIIAFASNPAFKCYSIIDERSAAYYALGMAKQQREPVAIVCTSGTAVLNYAPALAEAFYQEVPIIAVTADRPTEWLDQEDGQTIHQENIFRNYIRLSCQMPDEVDAGAIDKAEERLCEFDKRFRMLPHGPAHINVPLDNPLYGQTTANQIVINKFAATLPLLDSLCCISEIWNKVSKVMIVVGINTPDPRLDALLKTISDTMNCVVVAAPTSNINYCTIGTPENVIAWLPESGSDKLAPDLLITLGNAVVSKRLKTFLRQNKPQYHIDVDLNPMRVDTYRCLSHKLIATSEKAAEFIINNCRPQKKDYKAAWQKAADSAQLRHHELVGAMPWCDLSAIGQIICFLSEQHQQFNLHASNSTPVRYVELFNKISNADYYCNRGTSGIDGCLSTAAGASLVSDNQTIVITGDVGFFYDSNCFYNNLLQGNFKVILINNGGGNIFKALGYAANTLCAEFFITPIKFNVGALCQSFGVRHLYADNAKALDDQLSVLIDSVCCTLLEVDTRNADNSTLLRNYLNSK